MRKEHLFCLSLLLFAQSVKATDYTWINFNTTTNLTLNGTANTTNTADGKVIRLVGRASNQAGSVFSSVAVRASFFSANFMFRITETSGVGADGLAFVVQGISSNSVGTSGGYLGYGGITNSFGVEFDTFRNSNTQFPNFHDPPGGNHFGIVTNGNLDHGVDFLYTTNAGTNLDDGNIWFAWVDYDGTNVELRANGTGIRPINPTLSRPLNVVELLGKTNAFVGFTAGTGRAYETIDLLSFSYRDIFDPIFFTNQVPVWISRTNSGVQIGWQSYTNAHYQVQVASNLDNVISWTDFGTSVPGNGGTNFYLDFSTTGKQKFYRVMTRP